MSGMTRRQLLQLLAGCVTSAGSVVLARSVLAGEETATGTPANPDERADRLAEELPASPEEAEASPFLNGAFRNGGGFRNGAFRNGGFANGGGFRNGAFRNGAFRNW
jgi:hypothetical protein